MSTLSLPSGNDPRKYIPEKHRPPPPTIRDGFAPPPDPVGKDPLRWCFPFAHHAFHTDPLPRLPLRMELAKRFIVWAFWWQGGRWSKQPRNPFPRSHGKLIDIKDQQYYVSYAEAVQAFGSGRRRVSGDRIYPIGGNPRFQLDGIGFVLGNGFIGVDIDKCVDATGTVAPWAQEILDQLPSTYAELSPSRTGIKLFLRGTLAQDDARSKFTGLGPEKTGAVEIYTSDRYFTVTGLILPGRAPQLTNLTNELNTLHASLTRACGARTQVGGGWGANAAKHAKIKTSRETRRGDDLGDEALIAKARAAKNGWKFTALYDRGNIAAYNGDDSAADLALCSILAFWTEGDEDRIDRLFRQSALMRPKWDHPGYRARTILKAVSSVSRVYRPKSRGR